MQAYFDGACQRHLGCGGCLLFRPDGQLLRAASVYYGAEVPTNNTAEGSAMLDCLKLVDDVEWQPSWQGLVVKGDSSLIVSFM